MGCNPSGWDPTVDVPRQHERAGADDFFNRERELAQLATAWQAPGAQLVTLWGCRRVGKSTLLSRFADGNRAVYFYGTRMTELNTLAGVTWPAGDI